MSRIKDHYIENVLNAQRWVSRVRFLCPTCGSVVDQEVDVPELNFAAEKSSEMTTEGEVEIVCETCDSYFEGDAWVGPFHCDIVLRDHEETSVNCEPPGYDRPPEDWLEEWSIPNSPKEVFDHNHSELKEIINTQASTDGASLMNRMIFAQILTFLEAYFCDTLIKGLRDNPDSLIKFAEKDGAIKEAKIEASAVLRDPNVIKNFIEKNLKNRLYHQFGSGKNGSKNGKGKLEGVPLWYRLAFDFSLTPVEADLDLLREYAILRHDCVHRNGETKDAEKLTLFDKGYLLKALDNAKRIVEHIDGEMQKLKGDLPF